MYSAFALHNVFTDHMVLQRGKPILISGVAAPGISVRGYFSYAYAETTADKNGEWVLSFPAMKEGGPYELKVISCDSVVVLSDILVGDVWICSGQSNMQFPVWGDGEFFRLPEGREVAGGANDDKLRLLQVPIAYSPYEPCAELPQGAMWKAANSFDTVAPFSAVGYFFGCELRKRFPDLPIGLVNASLGGTRIEPWMPRAGLIEGGLEDVASQVDAAIKPHEELLASPIDTASLYGGAYREWILEKFNKTNEAVSADAAASWYMPDNVSEDWESVATDKLYYMLHPGVRWFRTFFELPEECVGEEFFTRFAHIEDADEVWVDGVKIGETTPFEDEFWLKERHYRGFLGAGARHMIAVRVQNHFGMGGISGDMKLFVGSHEVDFALCSWEMRDEFVADIEEIGTRPSPAARPVSDTLFSKQLPTTLFNAMVAPLTKMAITGAIWYQGCANGDEPEAYDKLQRVLIDSWRKLWRDDDMPFIITQIAGFGIFNPQCRQPDDFWKAEGPLTRPSFAPFRAVQQRILSHHKAGIACTIDIGDHSDVHPPKKYDVGKRLASEAMRLKYGGKELPGAMATSAKRTEQGIEVVFENVGEGLYVEGGEIGPHLLAVIDEGGDAKWVEGRLEGNSLIVEDGGFEKVATVQYAYNGFAPGPFIKRKDDGFPVFPFKLIVLCEA